MPIHPAEIPSPQEQAAVSAAAGGGQDRPPQTKRRRRWRLRLLAGGLISAGIAAGAILLLPTALSTDAGTAWLMRRLSADLPGRVTARDLSLSWFAGQHARGLELWDPDGRAVGELAELELPERGLWELGRDWLTNAGPDLGAVRVDGGRLHLRQDAAGQMNLDRALGTQWFADSPSETTETDATIASTLAPAWASASAWSGSAPRRVNPSTGKSAVTQRRYEVVHVSETPAPAPADEPVLPPGLTLQLLAKDVVVTWRRGGEAEQAEQAEQTDDAEDFGETIEPAAAASTTRDNNPPANPPAGEAVGPEAAGDESVRVQIPRVTLTARGPRRLGLTLEAGVTRTSGTPATVDRGEVRLTAAIEDLFDARGRWSLPQSRYEVEGRVDQLPVSAVDRLWGRGELWRPVIGPTLNASWSVRGPVQDLAAEVIADSRRLRVRQALRLGPSGMEAGTTASEGVTLEITPASWSAMLGASRAVGHTAADPSPAVTLHEPFRMRASVRELRAPAADLAAGGVGLDLSATSYRLVLEPVEQDRIAVSLPGRPTLALTPRLTLTSKRADREAQLSLVCGLAAGDEREELRAGLHASFGNAGPDSPAGVRLTGGIARLPVGLLDWIGQQGDRLAATLGDSLAVGVEAVADGGGGYGLTVDFGHGNPTPADADRSDPPGVVNASVENSNQPGPSAGPAAGPRLERLTGRMTGGYRDGVVTLRTDERLGLWVVPEAFAQWMRPVAEVAAMGESVGLSLPEAAQVTADVDLSVALRESAGLRFDPDRTRLRATVQLPETTLVDTWYDRRFGLRDGQIRVDAGDLRQPVEVRVQLSTVGGAGESLAADTSSGPGGGGEAGAERGAERGGSLRGDVRLTGLMLDDGYVQLERGRVTAEVQLDRLPTVIFDTLTRQRGYAVAAFGEKLDAAVRLDGWSLAEGGAVSFELQSENQSLASFSGRDTGGRFVPDRPMTFYFNQTPALAGKIMRWVNPVLLPAVRSATVPFTLTIDDDGFRLPTRGFSFADLDADVQVQMGTVRIDPTIAPVNRIVQPLQRFNVLKEQLSYEARVSPIALRLRDGVLSYDTLRFRIDDVDLSFGGTVSLVDQAVDMRLHLGGREVERDPLLRTLAAGGIAIGGTVSEPRVNLDSLLDGLRQERLPETVGGILGGLLRRELEKRPDSTPPADPPADPAK